MAGRFRLDGMRGFRYVAALLAAVICVAGCGNAGAPRSQPMPPTTTQADFPTGGDEIAIQFSSGGGISGPCCAPSETPDITLYGDGRVVFTEDTDGVLPGMRQATLDRADVTELLNHAQTAGLYGKPDTGSPCCDLGYTRVILGRAGTTYEFSVMGLGQEVGDLTDEQRRTRDNVATLRKQLIDLANSSDANGGYGPTELAVYVRPANADDTAAPTPWPLGSLAEGGTPTALDGRCLHITDGTGAVVAAARDAKTNNWSSAGHTWWVIIRPLLPHEHGCP
jgi:hypothetical protein